MKLICRSLVTAVFLAVCGLAQAETIEFNSLNGKQGFPALLQGRAQYADKVTAVFTRPNNAQGSVPVMVIMHGSGGIGMVSTEAWSRFFLEMGIATLVVDSFGPRGIQSTASDQSQLTYTASTVDALMALQAVAKLPGVDAAKIGVIGFSRGGQASTNSSYVKVRNAVLGADSTLSYALHVALYGGCSQIGTPDKTPALFLLGDDDGYVSPATCERFADTIRSRGGNIELVVYPNAKHGFDQDTASHYGARVQSWKTCSPRYQDLDDLSYFIDGHTVSSQDFGQAMGKCTTTGVTFGGNPQASADAHARVKSFVRKHFAISL